MNKTPELPDSKNIITEASKKLIPIARQRELEEKFFYKKEEYNDSLNKFEEKLHKKIYYDKFASSNIDEKVLTRIYQILDSINKLNPSYITNISNCFTSKEEKLCQTEETDDSLLNKKLLHLEQENSRLVKENSSYKKDNEILLKENTELKTENEKLNKNYINLSEKIEEEKKNKNDITKEITSLKTENSNLNTKINQLNKTIQGLKQKTNAYEEKVQIELQKKESDINFLNFYKKINPSLNKKVTFEYLLKSKQLNEIYNYLDANDICNYRLACKEINKILENSGNKILKNFYLSIIKEKNQKIKRINKYDIQKEYLTKLPQLEQLIRVYSLESKQPGKELTLAIDNSLIFINKGIKTPLGIPESKPRQNYSDNNNYRNTEQMVTNDGNNNNSQEVSAVDSFFGGIKSMFGYGDTQEKTPLPPRQGADKYQIKKVHTQLDVSKLNNFKTEPNSSITTPRSKIDSKKGSFIGKYSENMLSLEDSFSQFDFEKSDEILLKEINNNDFGLKTPYEFEYTTPDDINKYLTKFLKSPFPVEKLTDFINKLCINFCNLLFSSYIAIKEISQLLIVAKSLNERFKYYYDLTNRLNKKLKYLINDKKSNYNKLYKVSAESKNKKDYSNANLDDNNNNNENEDEVKEFSELDYDELEKKLEIAQMNLNISNKKEELYKTKYEQTRSHFEQYKEMYKEENNSLKFKLELITNEKNNIEKKLEEFHAFFGKLLNEEEQESGDK